MRFWIDTASTEPLGDFARRVVPEVNTARVKALPPAPSPTELASIAERLRSLMTADRSAIATPGPARERSEGRTQRALSVRQREEAQEVLFAVRHATAAGTRTWRLDSRLSAVDAISLAANRAEPDAKRLRSSAERCSPRSKPSVHASTLTRPDVQRTRTIVERPIRRGTQGLRTGSFVARASSLARVHLRGCT